MLKYLFRHPTVLKPEKSKRSKEEQQDVNEIIKKILKQQTHLRSHIKKLESKNAAQQQVQQQPQQQQQAPQQHQDPEQQQCDKEEQAADKESRRRESQSEGKGYIMKTFLENVESEDFYSHDSGIGSALATNTDLSISKDSELKSLDTVLLDEGQYCDKPTLNNLSDCITEFEKIIDLNEKLRDNESHIGELCAKLEEVRGRLKDKGKEEFDAMQDKVEEVTKVNSSKSHEIKKNDIAISHMEKNIQGRQMFLSTIELDINRAESYAKRLQKEFEREFETVGLCNDILTVCNEDVETKDNDDKNVSSQGNGYGAKARIEDVCNKIDECKQDGKVKKEEGNNLVILDNCDMNSEFTVSATESPFGPD